MTDTPKPSYRRDDVLEPHEVRAALGIASDKKWEDVKARMPWSDALGARTLRISWADVLDWLAESKRRVA